MLPRRVARKQVEDKKKREKKENPATQVIKPTKEFLGKAMMAT